MKYDQDFDIFNELEKDLDIPKALLQVRFLLGPPFFSINSITQKNKPFAKAGQKGSLGTILRGECGVAHA